MKPLFPSLVATFIAATLSARGVVVTSGIGNTMAPLGNPYFANVGQLNGASAIYLGNGWVMTADHVAGSLPASVTFGGVPYATQAGTWQQLTNPVLPGVSTYADIVLFRLAASPVLSSMTVSTGVATAGDDILFAGNSRAQSTTLTTWNVVTGPLANDDVWTEGGTPTTNSGYKTGSTHVVSWGENEVSSGPVIVNTGTFDTVSFYTTFDQTGGPAQEGQGVNGDSGGAAFYFTGTSWELIGMTHAVSSYENQPTVSGIGGSIAVYGNQTYFAELAYYQPQISAIVATPEVSTASLLLLGFGGCFRRCRSRRG